jgi:signal transduction histidine kinase
MTRPTQRLQPVDRQSSAALEHLAALERLNRIISAFASMVSHETRSALVGIQGLSELIQEGDVDLEEARGYAGDIFREAQKINNMIGEMFDLNRLETGQSALRRVPVDLNRVAEEVVDEVRDKSSRIAIELDVQAQRSLVLGDPDRLQQAIHSVLVFCTRTAQPGSLISVVTTSDQTRVRISVRSSSMKVIEFDDWLYGRYERYESRPSAMMGAGLGLAISRAIIELHDGRIAVGPMPKGGAEFELSLPAT